MTTPAYQEIYDTADKQTTYVIRCRPEEIDIVILGNTLHGANVNGINGTFFDTPNPKLTTSCWGLAVNDGKPIGENAHTVDYGGLKRGVVCWDGENLICRRINHFREVTNMIWGISGVMLMPSYDRYVEKYADDIYRKTHHTVVGYDKDYNVYLMVRTDSSMTKLIQVCAELGLVGAVSLDGGGSSQLNYNGKGYKSSRKINSAVIVMG